MSRGHFLFLTCVWLLPRAEVEGWDERMRAGQHVLRPLGAREGVGGDPSDVAVVADDAGQRDSVKASPLGAGEHAFPLPPKPSSSDKIRKMTLTLF